MFVLLYGSETMLWREIERSRIRVGQMDNLKDLVVTKRKDRVPNARIRESLSGVAKGVNESIEENVLRWFGHLEGM